jgi:23S rRNA pseudouridine955/2504/2580 synthase
MVADLEQHILMEDDRIIVFNKPSGLAVHGGSGLTFGLIEGLRALRPDAKFLELVHRLDRETSGCILVAKKRSALRHLHEQLRMGHMDKQYLALVRGQWPDHRRKVKAALQKNILQSGERMVNADEDGKPSETLFSVKRRFSEATLVCASPVTGRTHQIRVHCQFAGHVIAGDPKYGDTSFNTSMAAVGLKRLFLHAHRLTFAHPENDREVTIEAPLSSELVSVLGKLNAI